MQDMTMTIGGSPVTAAAVYPIHNPATGELVAEAPNATLADLDRAVDAAQAAFPGWAATPDGVRAKACSDIAALISDHGDELARLLVLEQGKPLNGPGNARFEIGGAEAWAAYTAGLSLPVKVLQDGSEGRVSLHRKPLGVVGSITPWNFPVMIAVWHILPAIRSGNTVVIKPSPNTPLATLRLIELMNKVLPTGVVNCVTSDDRLANIGAAMSEHPVIRKIVFTGSCATGRHIMASAADTMKRLTLEMGGNDAGIVLPDVDPAAIAEGLFWGAFVNTGQTCAAMKRLYVHDAVYDAVCDALATFASNVPMGDGMNEDNVLGPLQNKAQFDKVVRLVEDAKARGRVLAGGRARDGLFYEPTIIADLKNGDPLVDEEQFGPVLPIIRYTDIDEAIAAANDSENGLGGSIWTQDIEKARALALRMECGSVWINKHAAIQPNAPFGGVKMSGQGTEFAQEGLEEYTDIQVVFS
ncbi:MAG: aldehyde dehydrogenase family protein [Pseudooceanicola sp.]